MRSICGAGFPAPMVVDSCWLYPDNGGCKFTGVLLLRKCGLYWLKKFPRGSLGIGRFMFVLANTGDTPGGDV